MVPQYIGPDGTQLIQVDGPYAAPTQHCSEYNVAVIVGAGIGVTPLRATMQSIIHHKWPKTTGPAHPDHGHFHWMLRWSDLATFAFMMRTIVTLRTTGRIRMPRTRQSASDGVSKFTFGSPGYRKKFRNSF